MPRVACSACGKRGRSESAKLTFSTGLSHGTASTRSRNSAGAAPSSSASARRGSALQTTARAAIAGAVLELDALAGPDRRHRRAGGDHRAGLARRVGERERHAAHPAAHVGPGARVAGEAPARVVPGDRGGAGVARRGERPDHALAGERVDHRGRRRSARASSCRSPRTASRSPPRRRPRRSSISSRDGGSASHRSSGPSGRSASRMRRVEPDVLAVAAAVGVAELRHRARLVDPLRERAAVLARDGDVGVLGPQRDQLVAVAVQRELLDHERVQEPGEVGARRDRVARPRLLERARAADLVAALEHEHAAAGAGEVGGGGQPVVPRADDDGVPAPGGEFGGRHAPDPKRPLTFSVADRTDRLYFVSTWHDPPHSARTPASRSG